MSAPAAVPPSWKDLSKSASDLLNKDFPINGTQLEVKTKTPSNVTFKVAGLRDSKSAAINGDIEGKYVDAAKGVIFTQGWTTSNVLKSQLELENNIAKGLKLDIQSSLLPNGGGKSALAAAIYKQPGLHGRAFLDLFKGPTFTLDSVVGKDGFLAGGEASYSVQDGKISKYAAAVGYSAPEYAVTLHGLNNLNVFAASYYHRVSRDVEAGAKAIYDTKVGPSNVNLEVGAKTYLDNAAFVKSKINNAGVLALGYTQALRPGVKASFGLALDTQRLNDTSAGPSAHKIGAAFTFES
ncbi:voltage-dependent ion-selective channel [Wallemia mellicola]|uniref:Voltage-dependent ion-selective channel n=1 Tax=Wallemia mellicola TaxID=1708541 RepID=A0A4T0TIW1_9BASI|nr:hypothetical protein E3Q24_01967 [Wallemia mellicola]TIB80050.1 voltage-dependent ion-selective channel [Wallemia mellicola]TIB84468.1 voltage-dependent ion-selective channel [Wallemia mellicola]TIB87602.1 voltage-dependent ion-selective channel [Wallemia mellicola]TIB91973.1 voltage-dependent ion-selective channel [Wallemia mellicola]